MLVSNYHMTIKLLCYCVLGIKTTRFCHIYIYMGLIPNFTKICSSLVVYQFNPLPH